MPKLQVLLPDAPEASHELSEETITVGRVEDNLLQIDDPSVSSHHAELTRSGDHYRLTDLGSTNGTRVNGNTVTEITLRGGEKVRFGHVETVYHSDSGDEPQPMPSEESHAALPATESHRPTDFANASPFQKKRKAKDKIGLLAMSAAVLAFLAFLAAVAVIVTLPAPTL